MPRFVDVLVNEHPEIPEGCCQRFQTLEEARPVHHVRYAPGQQDPQVWQVDAPTIDGSTRPAWATAIEDSGAGTALLIYGEELGLRLHCGSQTLAEPYLLLSREAIVD